MIKVLQYGESQPTIFLDVSDKVMTDRLGGFLSVTFHPQYKINGRFFVQYLRRDGMIIISQYQVMNSNPNGADPNSEKVILAVTKLPNGHMGGAMEFGADNYLYVSLGDGSPGLDTLKNGQNLESLLGKILRIDIDNPSGGKPYSSPSSNPFYGATPGLDEIYAYGFRNPFRFSFDRETGKLYVGDVGEKQKEEIDLVTAGGNYGWPIFEGTSCTNLDAALCNTSFNAIAPITEYGHDNGGCTAVGGYVYRGARASLPYGGYVFGDHCTGEIFMFYNGVQSRLLKSNLALSAFGEDEDGELYAIGLNGIVSRIVLENPQDPEVQLLTANTRMKLKGNSIYEIKWATTGIGLYRHDIQWSSDGGQTWEDVVGGLAGNVRSYEWTVPNIKSKRVRLRVISYGSRTTGQDESDEDFIIKPIASN